MKRGLLFVSLMVLVLLLAACNSSASGDSADENGVHKIIMTHELPTTFFKHDYMEKFKEIVEDKSDGRLEVTIHPSGQLFTDGEAVQNLGTGSVHMVWPVSVHLEALSDEYGIVNLPFSLDDETVLQNAESRKQLTELLDSFVADNGIKVLGLMRTAEGIILSNKDIKTMDDLEGLKIRSVGGHVGNDLLAAYGATAVSMPATEITTSLTQGAIDGINTSPDGWSDVVGRAAKNGFVVPQMQIFTYSLAADKKWFEGLPEDLQDIIQETLDDLIVDQWNESIELDKQFLDDITNDYGTLYVVPENELDEWKERAQEVHEKFAEKYPEAMEKFREISGNE